MSKKSLIVMPLLAMAFAGLSGCSCSGGNPDVYFTYEDINFDDKIGNSKNDEAHAYDSIKVNKLDNELRQDFAFGVDASMTKVVEDNGGIYFNQKGQEQDVYQILRRSGVNFIRFRLWNNPYNKWDNPYGGGTNDLASDIAMAKRAKAANLNVMIDFHYSDFWADPDTQNIPLSWVSYSQKEIPEQIKEYTTKTLQAFKDEGVTVDAVQIGNEINNGMAGFAINWNDYEKSFDTMSEMIAKGIEGAKAVFPNTRTVIHLANGGNTAEFENFFLGLNKRNINYDIIGASFYPHLSGSLEDLQTNLNNVSEKANKPVMIAETSWGFTDDYVVKTAEGKYVTKKSGEAMAETDTLITENSYSSDDEDVGGYLTSEQAQATALRDITNVLAKVPNNKGLGIFYWEPGWLPVENAGWATAAGKSYKYVGNDSKRKYYEETEGDGKATWSNQGLFSYTGKALASLNTYSYLKEGFNSAEEKSVSARTSIFEGKTLTINLAANEKLPTTYKVVTDFDAIRDASVVWEDAAVEAVKTKGLHTGLKGTVDGKYQVSIDVNCIENFIVDPGFENQGEDDSVKDPWKVESVTPEGEKVVKLDRKKDIRSGKTDLNWFHSSKDFTFTFSQTTKALPAGTYTLRTYIMAVALNKIAHTKLELFYELSDGTKDALSICDADHLAGWSEGYKECVIANIQVPEGATMKVGMRGAAKAGAWAHNDDWELVSNN